MDYGYGGRRIKSNSLKIMDSCVFLHTMVVKNKKNSSDHWMEEQMKFKLKVRIIMDYENILL
jgi:hypothetical protein